MSADTPTPAPKRQVEVRDVPAGLRFTADVMDAWDRERGERLGRRWEAIHIVETAKYASYGLSERPTKKALRDLRADMGRSKWLRWHEASFAIFSALSDLVWADGYDSPGRSSDDLRHLAAAKAGESR